MSRNRESATAWPWRSFVGGDPPLPSEPLPSELLAGGAADAARGLLGSVLISTVGGTRTAGVVVETEAYSGPDDPASHAREALGRTARNAVMFGPPGRSYVYLIYGIHWCLNVVTGPEEHPAAVLFRGLAPVVGMEAMARRRGRETDLCSGPGRLCQALGVTGRLDGHPLDRPPLELRGGWRLPDERVGVSGRIGVRAAAERPLRFYLRNHPAVSRAPRA